MHVCSISSHLRTPILTQLLQPALASARGKLRVRHVGHSNVHARIGGLAQFEQEANGPGLAWSDILEDCSLCRDPGFGHERNQSSVGELALFYQQCYRQGGSSETNILTDIHLHKPRGRCQRTPCPSIRSSRTPESALARQQPPIFQAQHETRRDTADVQPPVCEEVAIGTTDNPIPFEDFKSQGE